MTPSVLQCLTCGRFLLTGPGPRFLPSFPRHHACANEQNHCPQQFGHEGNRNCQQREAQREEDAGPLGQPAMPPDGNRIQDHADDAGPDETLNRAKPTGLVKLASTTAITS